MKRLGPLVLFAMLAGCANMPDIAALMTPYRIDVRQGNFITPQMVAQLKPGQTRDQVRFILGTPLVTDPFHADRWDYIYRLTPGHGTPTQQRVSVYFAEGKLTRFDGDVPANATPTPVAAIDRVVEIGPKAGAAAASTKEPARN